MNSSDHHLDDDLSFGITQTYLLVDANVLDKHTASILRPEVAMLGNRGLIWGWKKGRLRQWANQERGMRGRRYWASRMSPSRHQRGDLGGEYIQKNQALLSALDCWPHLLQNISAGSHMKTERRLAMRLFPSSRSSNPNSLDTEGLFDLEGMEEVPTESFHSEEETDTDGGYLFFGFLCAPRALGFNTNWIQLIYCILSPVFYC